MSRYTSYVDITGIEDDTIAMRIKIEDRVFRDFGPLIRSRVYDAVSPFMDDVEKFLEEARKWVNIVKSTDPDYDEPVVDEDLSWYDLSDADYRRDY